MQEKESSTFQIMRTRSAVDAGEHTVSGSEVFVIEESLGYLLNYAARLGARMHAQCLEQHNVTLGQWAVLMFLWVEDGVTQTELSRQVAIEDATMVRSIDRMERDGLVRRQRNPNDRRQLHIFLTDKGHSLRDVLVPCAIAGNAALTKSFTAAETAQVHDLLRRMIATLRGTPALHEQEHEQIPTDRSE